MLKRGRAPSYGSALSDWISLKYFRSRPRLRRNASDAAAVVLRQNKVTRLKPPLGGLIATIRLESGVMPSASFRWPLRSCGVLELEELMNRMMLESLSPRPRGRRKMLRLGQGIMRRHRMMVTAERQV